MHFRLISPVPFRKPPEAFAQGGGGLEAEVLFEGGGVGVGYGDIAGLHGDEFLVGLEVVAGGEDFGAEELLLENGDEVEEVFRLVVADVVYLVWRYGEAVLTVALLGGVLHHSDYAFHNVVNVGEVALAVSVVENLDGLALHQLVGEAEVGHVGTAGRTVDGEEAQAGAGDVVQLRIGVGHQFVTLLRGGVEAHGVVHLVVRRIGHLLVASVDRGTAGVDQVLHFVVAAGFEQVVEPDEVAFYVAAGIGDRVANTGLSGKVYHHVDPVLFEKPVNECLVRDAALNESPGFAQPLEFFQTGVFEAHIVIVCDGVDADDLDALVVVQQTFGKFAADKSGGTGDQNGLAS